MVVPYGFPQRCSQTSYCRAQAQAAVETLTGQELRGRARKAGLGERVQPVQGRATGLRSSKYNQI